MTSKVKSWAEHQLRRLLGYFFAVEGEDGHNRLCRFVSFVCHYGPSGTFAHVAHVNLDTGGHVCMFGTCCGRPTESYMEQMHERLEWFHATEKLLTESGGLVSMVWENPRFSVSVLCDCGQSENSRFPDHAPLCGYRVKHDFPITVEEYKDAIALVN